MTAPEQASIVELSATFEEDKQAQLMTGAYFIVLGVAIYHALKEWPEKRRRAQLLAAYRERHSWKKGDLSRLRALDVNKWALRRMERLVGRGRPVVPKARTLLEEIEDKLNDIVLLFDRHTPSIGRRRALRNWPCWPEYVEALYRGEYFKAKESGVKSPSEEAERSVGRALGMSEAAVRKTCGGVRRKRAACPDRPNMPAITLAEFEGWFEADDGFLRHSPAAGHLLGQ